jgi:hypothetical protein
MTSENDKDQERQDMNTDNTRDEATPSPASVGSQPREQIAALVHDAMRFDREAKTPKWQGGNSYAESRARQAAWQIATLFQPTLTDEERWAISEAAGAYNDNDDDEECAKIAATLHGLLKRLG